MSIGNIEDTLFPYPSSQPSLLSLSFSSSCPATIAGEGETVEKTKTLESAQSLHQMSHPAKQQGKVAQFGRWKRTDAVYERGERGRGSRAQERGEARTEERERECLILLL